MSGIDFTQDYEEPTKHLDDLSPEVLKELGYAMQKINEGYTTLREYIIGDTDCGEIVDAEDLFDILTSYAKNTDIESIADSYQVSPEYIVKILKTVGFDEEELKKSLKPEIVIK